MYIFGARRVQNPTIPRADESRWESSTDDMTDGAYN